MMLACGALNALPAVSASNIVINGGFEVPLNYNGTILRHFPPGDAAYLGSVVSGKQRAWTQIDAQGWHAEGGDADGVSVIADYPHSGARCLRVTAASAQPRSVISSFEPQADAGPVTLTAWVRSSSARATLSLDLVNGWNQVQQHVSVSRQSVDLPFDSKGWTRVSVTAIASSKLASICRLSVTSGTVWMDDVQISQGAKPSEFNVRLQEWLRLSVSDSDQSGIPQLIAGATIPLVLTNDSRMPLTGRINVYFGPWNAPKQRTVAVFDASSIAPGSSRKMQFNGSDLPAGAYVFTISLTDNDKTVLDGADDFFPLQVSGGAVSNGAVGGRDALRIIIVPATPHAAIFGVNNGMVNTGKGNWFGGYDPQECVDAGAIGVTCNRGHYSDDAGYASAMGGMVFHATYFDSIPPGPFGDIDWVGASSSRDGVNPAHPEYLDLADPIGLARLKGRAEQTGRWLAQRPTIASYQMANESPLLNHGQLCPSAASDLNFRNWCREQHGALAQANKCWNTQYTSWDQVEQIISARFLDLVSKQPKPSGAAAIDWTASGGHLDDSVLKRMNDNPGLAMDWLRWQTAITLRAYNAFRAASKRYSPETLFSTNLCWPDFFPEMAMPFYRSMDVTMVDLQYTSGMPRALGSPYEMMDAMEMAETCAPGKPVWGIETYYQPQWPAEYMALQNWGLLAHGMTNNLVFDWKPYSDAGPVKGTRAWASGKAPPMWFIIDNDETKLPSFETYKRSLDEIAAYHTKYNGLTVKRIRTDAALYVSLDTAQYVEMQTGRKPWLSPWQRTRNNLIFLLRLAGVSLDYVDDDTLPDSPGAYRKIVVPAAYVLSQNAAEKLARFAQRGGTVVLAGTSGVCDPWLRKYDNIGGPAWSALNWSAPGFTPDYAAGSKEFRGVRIGDMAGGTPLTDSTGAVIGWQRPWGKGKLIASGIFPDTYVTDPHVSAAMESWAGRLIELGSLPITGRWQGTGDTLQGAPGTGSPVVEVVVRQKSDADRFVFVLNQGGAGSGTVEVQVTAGSWNAVDIVSGKPLSGDTVTAGVWRMPLTVTPFGYDVIRLTRRCLN